MILCHQFTREHSELYIMPSNKCSQQDIKVQNKLPTHTISVGLPLHMHPFLPGSSQKSYGPNHMDAMFNLMGTVLLYSGCLKVLARLVLCPASTEVAQGTADCIPHFSLGKYKLWPTPLCYTCHAASKVPWIETVDAYQYILLQRLHLQCPKEILVTLLFKYQPCLLLFSFQEADTSFLGAQWEEDLEACIILFSELSSPLRLVPFNTPQTLPPFM